MYISDILFIAVTNQPAKALSSRVFYCLKPMPNAAPKPCNHPGCGKLTTLGARCELHKKQAARKYDDQRESSTKRGYGYKWQLASKGFLKTHPLCECLNCKPLIERERAALGFGDSHDESIALAQFRPEFKSEVVDHITPHKLSDANASGNAELIARARLLMWGKTNWQAMTKHCHDSKTARENGGFGRKVGAV